MRPAEIQYLDGIRAAGTVAELERAIRAPFKHRFHGAQWRRICRARIEAAHRIIAAHPLGRYVPVVGERRRLTICGRECRVGYGQNGAGERWVWHAAETWAIDILRAEGMGKRAAHLIWSNATDGYPHRTLDVVEQALAGKLPDPRFDRLIYRGLCTTGTGVHVPDREEEAKNRAHRPCKCGGWLWDWGAGWCGYADFISWRCDRCPRTYTEYLSPGRLYALRNHGARRSTP